MKKDNSNRKPFQNINQTSNGSNNVQVVGNVHIIKQYETFEPSRARSLAHCPHCQVVQSIDAIICRDCKLDIRQYWTDYFNYLTFMTRLARVRRLKIGLLGLSFLLGLPFIIQHYFFESQIQFNFGFLMLFFIYFVLMTVLVAKDKIESAMRENRFFDQKDLANKKTDVMKQYDNARAAAFGEMD